MYSFTTLCRLPPSFWFLHFAIGCGYAVHADCQKLVPHNCPKALNASRDPNFKREITAKQFSKLTDLVTAMHADESGVPLKEKRTLLKTYSDCFTGADAVSWLLSNLPIRDRDEGTGLCARLLELGYFKAMKDEKKGFRDIDTSLYAFVPLDKVPKPKEPDPDIPSEVGPDDFETLHAIGKGGFAKVGVKRRQWNEFFFLLLFIIALIFASFLFSLSLSLSHSLSLSLSHSLSLTHCLSLSLSLSLSLDR
jgi:hypothetical protein